MKLSLQQLTSVIATYVARNKISVATFSETRDNSVGLLDTIGKIFTITHNYVDKLEVFDGEFLSFGKTVEEWANDLILVEDYRPNGEYALSRHELTYRPVYFSYTLGRKVIPITIANNDIERAVHNEGQFVSIIEGKTKALSDSKTMFKYATKRQLLGVLDAIAEDMMDSSQADYTTTNGSSSWATISSGVAGEVGDILYVNITGGTYNGIYQVVKPIADDETKTAQQLIQNGYIIKMDLVEELAYPDDATKGEAFVIALKKAVEVASDFSEGHSLNGATLGATPEDGLYLLVRQGVMPNIEVKTQAGAFHLDKVALPTKVIPLPDFGNASSDVYAILVDARGLKLHPTYDAVRENVNGDGDFLNMFQHFECTCHCSRNVYFRVFKKPA